MSNNAAEIVVAADGAIRCAPFGTTLPTATGGPTETPNAAFTDLGYASEDGVTLTSARTIEERMAWQSMVAVRRDETGREDTFATNLLQWNEDTVKTAFGGGDVVEVATNVYSYEPPAAGDGLDELSVLIDWQDGDKNYRLIIAKATIDGDTEVNLTRADMAILPVTFKALQTEGAAAWRLVSDDPAFVGAGS